MKEFRRSIKIPTLEWRYPSIEEQQWNELELLQRNNRWLGQITRLLFSICILLFCIFCMIVLDYWDWREISLHNKGVH